MTKENEKEELFEVDVTLTIGNGIPNMGGPSMDQAVDLAEDVIDPDEVQFVDYFGGEITEVRRKND